tara:strand:- start:27 stop:431 length:405 start_codon:yes stop_codon:yes gene_type:complete
MKMKHNCEQYKLEITLLKERVGQLYEEGARCAFQKVMNELEKEYIYIRFCSKNITTGHKNDKIRKSDIGYRFRNWYQENYQQKPPKSMELYDYLDKRLGKYRKRGRCWWGYEIIYEPTDSEDEEGSAHWTKTIN